MNMISIEKMYYYHASMVVGLKISGLEKFSLILGCSLINSNNEILDLPYKQVIGNGSDIWHIKLEKMFYHGPSSLLEDSIRSWSGRIIFALWKDESFTKRIEDTGWISFYCPWLMGGSTAGLDIQDEEIQARYTDNIIFDL